jgi:hypothetical protein
MSGAQFFFYADKQLFPILPLPTRLIIWESMPSDDRRKATFNGVLNFLVSWKYVV